MKHDEYVYILHICGCSCRYHVNNLARAPRSKDPCSFCAKHYAQSPYWENGGKPWNDPSVIATSMKPA